MYVCMHLDGDAVLAEVSHLDELMNAVDREVAFDLCTQVGSGRDAHCMGTHHLERDTDVKDPDVTGMHVILPSQGPPSLLQ